MTGSLAIRRASRKVATVSSSGVAERDPLGQLAARGPHRRGGRGHQARRRRPSRRGRRPAAVPRRWCTPASACGPTGGPVRRSAGPRLRSPWPRRYPGRRAAQALPSRPACGTAHRAWPRRARVGRQYDAGHRPARPRPARPARRTRARRRHAMTQPEGQTARDIFPEDEGIPEVAQDDSPTMRARRGPGVRPAARRAARRQRRLRHHRLRAGRGRVARRPAGPRGARTTRPTSARPRTRSARRPSSSRTWTPRRRRDSGTERTADDIEATADAPVGGEGPEESAVHVTDG